MSKRIIAIALALVLLICFMAIPVAADSADEDLPYIELTKFDDNFLMGIEQGAFYVMGDYGYVLDFSLTLGQINAYGYEVTYSYSGNRPNVTGTSFGNTGDVAFNSRYVEGTNLGKIRGTFKGAVGSDFGISFNSAGCYITVHSVRVFVVNDFRVDLPATLFGSSTVEKNPGYNASVAIGQTSSIYIDDWRNYDMVDCSSIIASRGITSIEAVLFDNTSSIEIVVPFDVSYVNYSDYDGSLKNTWISVSCDLRGVDPATTPDSVLVIRFTSALNSGETGVMSVTSLYGSVLIESPDEYLPFLKLITLALGNSVDFISVINNNLYHFGENFKNYSVSVFSKFDDIKNALSSSFDDFKTFWNSSLDEKIVSFQEYLLLLEEESLKAEKLLWWNDVLEDLNTLVDGIPTDEDITNEMTSAGDQLADLGQQMAAGTPDISVSDINVDIDGLVSAGGMSTVSSLASTITSNSIISSMLMIVASMALIGYVFFGKR